MDSFRDRLNTCDSPEGPTNRQYEDIILQALSSEYDRIRQTHLERRHFGLAGIHHMMAAIYADNLSCSEPLKGIAGHGTAMQAVDRDRTSVLCLLRPIWAFQKKLPTSNQIPPAAVAAASSVSLPTTTWSTSVKAARTPEKQRWRQRRPCVVFISQVNDQ